MSRRIGIFALGLGVLLLVLAGGFWLGGQQEALDAGVQADTALWELKLRLSQGETTPPPSVSAMEDAYLGILEIPSLELELPVMASWSYEKLKTAPCRQAGTVEGGDLVIAGHNYDAHFGRLSTLETGTVILFTDSNRRTVSYILAHLQTLPPDATEAVLESDYQLVLYTCTPGGARRTAAFCIREN